MDQLPPEILISIFDFVRDINDLIATSKTCKRFNEIISNHVKKLSIQLNEKVTRDEIKTASEEIKLNFLAIKSINLCISQDEFLDEKKNFIQNYAEHITQLTIKDMSFLNEIFDLRNFNNLHTLNVQKCDISSSSSELTDFILQACPKLKHFCIASCVGLDIDSLNHLGKKLNQTKIESFELLPSFAYFDIPGDDEDYWRIDNLKTLSVRTGINEVVVMKKGFVKRMLGRRTCLNLTKLELAAEINFSDSLVPLIVNNFPNLNSLVLSRGVSTIKNQDFVNICNNFKHLRNLQFHFNIENDLKMQLLKKNSSIEELTLGLTNDFPIDSLKSIRNCLSNLHALKIIYYNFKTIKSQEYHQLIQKLFPNVQFQSTGQKLK